MRLIYITILFYPFIGGAEILARNLARSVKKKGHDVRIVTGRFERKHPKREIKNGVSIERHISYGIRDSHGDLRFSTYTYMISLFLFLIKERKNYDIIHCLMGNQNAFISSLAGRLLKKPVVVQLGSSGYLFDFSVIKERKFGDFMVRKTIEKSDLIIASNRTALKQTTEFGCPDEKLILLPNGSRMIDRPDSVTELRRKLSIPEGDVVFLFVGSFNEIKGIPTLIEAWSSVVSEADNVHLIMIGDGPMAGKVKDFFENRGIAETITMPGRVGDVDDYFRISDCFVLPSKTEGISLALIEAMGAGLAPVVSANSGNIETLGLEDIELKEPLVTDSGMLFSVGDSDGLAWCIKRLVMDKTLLTKIAQNASNLARNKYDIEILAEKLEGIYLKLLSRNMEI